MIPPADVHIDDELVARLLREQHAELARLPLRYLKSGWDNCLYRLGEDLLIRLPRRQLGAELLLRERRFLPALAAHLPLPVSVERRAGYPGGAYPWDWSICDWQPGHSADYAPPAATAATQWSDFLRALHAAGPADGPTSPFRGLPLAACHQAFSERFERLCERALIEFDPVNSLWQAGLDADPTFTPVWLHGDLHPMNIICRGGRFVAVIDWGDICIGDPATDLASYYMLFPADIAEMQLHSAYGASRAQIDRARATALYFAVVLLETGTGGGPGNWNPQQVSIARRTLANLGLS